MAVKLNSKGNSHARSLAAADKVDQDSSWSFSAADGNKLLGADGDDWANYSKWHLGVDSDAEPDTKTHYKYPFGKNGKLYRSALRAIRSRAAQQKITDVFNAAGRLLDSITEEEDTMKTKPERRILFIEGLKVRAAKNETDAPKIVGYAAMFNKLSGDLGGFREKIAPGAFAESIKSDDIRALFNHDSNFVLGRTSAGTLTLEENKRGLKMEVEPPDAQWARDLMASIQRGDITQQSFSFNTLKQEWDETDKENVVRTLREVKLFDVGPVTFPAYEQTSVQVRSLEDSLVAAGLDIKTITRALLKHEHGLELTDNDRRAVDDVIAELQEVAHPSQADAGEGEQETEQDQEPTHQVELMRRNLELKIKKEEIEEVKE